MSCLKLKQRKKENKIKNQCAYSSGRWRCEIYEALWRESQWQTDRCRDGAGGSGGKGWGWGGSWNRLLPVAGNWGSVGRERVGRQCRRAESDTIRGAWAPQSGGCCRGGSGGANMCRKRRLDRVGHGTRGPLFLRRRSCRAVARVAWWEWRRVWSGWSRKSIGSDLQWIPQWYPTLSWWERERGVEREGWVNNEKWCNNKDDETIIIFHLVGGSGGI